MATYEKLKQEITELVAEIAEVEIHEIPADAELEKLGIDSLDRLRFIADVEKKYGIVINEEEIDSIRTLPDIFALVRRYVGEVK